MARRSWLGRVGEEQGIATICRITLRKILISTRSDLFAPGNRWDCLFLPLTVCDEELRHWDNEPRPGGVRTQGTAAVLAAA